MGRRKRDEPGSEKATGTAPKAKSTGQASPDKAAGSAAKLPVSERAWWYSKCFRLPLSSVDLEVPCDHVRDILTCFEVLQAIGTLLLLEPFSFDELCTALACKERCRLIRDVHMCLLSAVLEDDYQRGVRFGSQEEEQRIRLQVRVVFFCMCWL